MRLRYIICITVAAMKIVIMWTHEVSIRYTICYHIAYINCAQEGAYRNTIHDNTTDIVSAQNVVCSHTVFTKADCEEQDVSYSNTIYHHVAYRGCVKKVAYRNSVFGYIVDIVGTQEVA